MKSSLFKDYENNTGKKYIGYHKGKFDGTYHHSTMLMIDETIAETTQFKKWWCWNRIDMKLMIKVLF